MIFTKECTECHRLLLTEQFSPRADKGPESRRGVCRDCMAKYKREYRERNPSPARPPREAEEARCGEAFTIWRCATPGLTGARL